MDAAPCRSAVQTTELLMEYQTTQVNRPLDLPLGIHGSYYANLFGHLFDKLDRPLYVVMVKEFCRSSFFVISYFSLHTPSMNVIQILLSKSFATEDYVYNAIMSSLAWKLWVNCLIVLMKINLNKYFCTIWSFPVLTLDFRVKFMPSYW